MGKAKKNKKKMARFDPLARPAASSADMDDAVEVPEKKLSAHQQRHLERKRLQAEAQALKQQKRKVSKADKLAWQREKKELSRALKTSRQALRDASSSRPVAASSDAPVEEALADDAPAPFAGFDLPAPRGGADAVGGGGAPMFGGG